MMRLNLLPWRERQRQATLRRFRSRLVAGAILALCAVMLVDQLARQRGQQQALSNTRQQAALERLAEQLRPLDDVRAQHQALLERLAALERLRTQQGILGDVFTELEGALPMGVQLLDLNLENGHLQLAGLATSGAVVAQFMRDLEHSRVLLDLELSASGACRVAMSFCWPRAFRRSGRECGADLCLAGGRRALQAYQVPGASHGRCAGVRSGLRVAPASSAPATGTRGVQASLIR